MVRTHHSNLTHYSEISLLQLFTMVRTHHSNLTHYSEISLLQLFTMVRTHHSNLTHYSEISLLQLFTMVRTHHSNLTHYSEISLLQLFTMVRPLISNYSPCKVLTLETIYSPWWELTLATTHHGKDYPLNEDPLWRIGDHQWGLFLVRTALVHYSPCRGLSFALTIVQWFTWDVSVGYEWLPTVVPLRNTVVPLKNIVDSTWVSQEL